MMQLKEAWIYALFVGKNERLTRLKISEVIVAKGNTWFTIDPKEIKDVSSSKGFFFSRLRIEYNSGKSIYIGGIFHHRVLSAVRIIKLLLKWPQIKTVYDQWNQRLLHATYIPNSEFLVLHDSICSLPLPEQDDLESYSDLAESIIEAINELITAKDQGRQLVDKRNDEFVRNQKVIWKDFLDNVEKKPLTEAQREAVLHNEDNMHIVAGAGTGKTSTIIAKVGYLLKSGLAGADEILLLAFTREAAGEMRKRIMEKFHCELNVHTFHALGMHILTEVEKAKPLLSNTAADEGTLKNHLTAIVTGMLSNDDFVRRYVDFLANHCTHYQSPFEFDSLGAYINSFGAYGRRTLKNEPVKSHEEREIANWLFLNGIEYIYEAPYKVDTRTAQYRSYTPDFYLPDYDIYIEHFGIDHNGQPAKFINQKQYLEGMKWKRETHLHNNTTLIETFSYERMDGVLLEKLQQKLSDHQVRFNPLNDDKALDIIKEIYKVDPFIRLSGPFMNLFKAKGETVDWLHQHITSVRATPRTKSFISLFEDIYTEYEKQLVDKKEIDFQDMINKAAGHVQKGGYISPFKYILVDEFQDISSGRSKLIQYLRDQMNNCRLFCVGDDWQSIYRFTGSDISLMTKFSKQYGFTRRVDLDRTFRFDDKMSDFSGYFILKNPSQLPKYLVTNRTSNLPAVTIIIRQGQEDCLGQILKEIETTNPNATVLLLERYNSSIPEETRKKERMQPFSKMTMKWTTAHKSKGTEADYVILGGLSAGIHGFPSEIIDDPLIELILAEPDQYPYGEERRLFYVAITRARKHTYIIAEGAHPSSFIQEILGDNKYFVLRKGIPEQGNVSCLECETGLMVARDGADGIFYSCSNYPHCNYTENACSKCHKGRLIPVAEMGTLVCSYCKNHEKLCPACLRGRLVLKNGKYGPFYGCTMWRSETHTCRYRREIVKDRAESMTTKVHEDKPIPQMQRGELGGREEYF